MVKHLETMVEALVETMLFECRQTAADQGEFEILVGELRRSLHSATCRARVRYCKELEREGGDE